MAIQTNFPAVKPALLLDFAKNKRLDSRITFTRTTTATYYDGFTTAKAEENLLLQSQDFTTTWTTTNITVTANTTTAPDGTSTAETIDDGTATAAHNINQLILGIKGATTYVFSCFLKDINRQFATLTVSDSPTTYAAAKFDLVAGTAGSTQAGGGVGWSVTSSSITAAGNGWYRCVLIFVPATVVTSFTVRIGTATNSTTFTASERGLESYTGSNKQIYIWGAQLEQRSSVIAYTATTTQAITNYIPVLQTAVAGQARFDHNPVTSESLGLLVEEQRTNLLLYSAQLGTPYPPWYWGFSTVTSDIIVSPDGRINGDKIEETAVTQEHYIRQSVTGLTTNTTYTVSIFVKAAERTRLRIRALDQDIVQNGYEAFYNLTTGTVINAYGTGAGSLTGTSITPVGNGWYRCAVSGNTGTGTKYIVDYFIGDNSGSFFYPGVTGSGLFLWGAQLEAGRFSTSYIPTVAATVTRNAEAASMTGSNFTSWYNQGEGTFFVAYRRYSDKGAGNQIPFMVSDGTGNNIITISDSPNGSNDRVLINTNGVSQMNAGAINYTANQLIMRSIRYKFNDCATSANGAAVATDTSVSIPVVNQLSIGYAPYFGSSRIDGTISKIAYYPLRVTDAQLQALTS